MRATAMRSGTGTGATGLKWLLDDHLGSTAITADGATGSNSSELRYTGQRMEGIGLYDYGARWFDPSLVRFIQADTLVPNPGDPQAWDRYAAMNNNPVVFVDPTGHSFDCAMGEYGCRSGELPPSSLIELYRGQYDLGNRMNPADIKGRNNLIHDADSFLRGHSQYGPSSDPRLSGWDKFEYRQLRNEYWMQRVNGNEIEAYNLQLYYDEHQTPQISNWDGSNIDWVDVGLDTAGLVSAIVGLNEVTSAYKINDQVKDIALGVGFATSGVSGLKSVREGNKAGLTLTIAGALPGPFGVIGSGMSLLYDLSQGHYFTPFVPSVVR